MSFMLDVDLFTCLQLTVNDYYHHEDDNDKYHDECIIMIITVKVISKLSSISIY